MVRRFFDSQNNYVRAFQVAMLIGITAQLRISVIPDVTDGFVVALDVVALGVFLYCYTDSESLWIIGLSAVVSPLMRAVSMTLVNGELVRSFLFSLPDAVFFGGYAVTFAIIRRFITRTPRDFKSFPYVVFFCDLFGNATELVVRSFIFHKLSFGTVEASVTIVVALLRTVAIVMLAIAIDTYSNQLLNIQKTKEYERLLTKFTIIHEEITMMDKNIRDVEVSMKQAYALYNQLDRQMECPASLSRSALEIAKRTHEVKADYYNVISVLKGLFDKDEFSSTTRLSETVRLVVRNAREYAASQELPIKFITEIKDDFEITDSYKMMSVLRNLLNNSVEAFAESHVKSNSGQIRISSDRRRMTIGDECVFGHVIEVEDNGPGIPEKRLDTIFMTGYSTKFNYETGYIQRGLGLSIVKEYIETQFNGTIEVDSKLGEYTRFTIRIPIVEK